MRRILLLALLFLVTPAWAIEPEGFDDALEFEGSGDALPTFWGGGPSASLSLDQGIVHGGEGAARLQRDASTPQSFSVLTGTIELDFEGESIELRGFARSEAVDGWFGLWMRIDGPSGPVAFDNMQKRGLKGTTEWTEYSITLPLRSEGRQIYFGALIAGTGTLWVDDLSLHVDGKPLRDAKRREVEPTALDLDTEFDDGSGLTLRDLDASQHDRLTTLGELWGYLKYHHPRVTTGELHWDYELFRVVPKLLEAEDPTQAFLAWLDELGPVPDCDPCVGTPEGEEHLPSPVAATFARFDPAIRARLQALHARRPAGQASFYLDQAPGVGNPVLSNEPPYEGRFDDGFRLLALFRLWNVVQYAFPYRDVLGADWPGTLREFVPKILDLPDPPAYARVLLELIARVEDTHCNLWSGLVHRPPSGTCDLPIVSREVRGQVFVDALRVPAGFDTPFVPGDLVLEVEGRAVDELYADVQKFYAASNEPRRRHDFARSVGQGACETVEVTVDREGRRETLEAARFPLADLDGRAGTTHDRGGEFLQDLGEGVLYATLSLADPAKLPALFARAEEAAGLVIDIRNYPAQFMVFALGQHLVTEPTEFVRFTRLDLDHPGRFVFSDPLWLQPAEPYLDLPVAVLVDETSLSQAEYTALAFSAAPRVTVVGSTTAGADGNVSAFPLPGGHRTMVSGLGVFHPDGRPTQKVGIEPDVVARPTVAGLRDGRDEVLEEAIRVILGDGFDRARIVEMARRPGWPSP